MRLVLAFLVIWPGLFAYCRWQNGNDTGVATSIMTHGAEKTTDACCVWQHSRHTIVQTSVVTCVPERTEHACRIWQHSRHIIVQQVL